MNCREVLDFLNAYLDRELPLETMREFDAHLAECPACVAYVETYRQTLAALRTCSQSPPAGMDPVPEEVIQAILAARVDAIS